MTFAASGTGPPVEAVVFWDYLCPWCYCLHLRLRALGAQPDGPPVRITWMPFPLRPLPDGRTVDDHTVDVWSAAERHLVDLGIGLAAGPLGAPLPVTSLPPLLAAQSALDQGPELFARFHDRIFRLFFDERADLDDAGVLVAAALESGLDAAAFVSGLAAPETADRLRRSYEVARGLGVTRVPTLFLRGPTGVVLRVDGATDADELARAVRFATGDTSLMESGVAAACPVPSTVAGSQSAPFPA